MILLHTVHGCSKGIRTGIRKVFDIVHHALHAGHAHESRTGFAMSGLQASVTRLEPPYPTIPAGGLPRPHRLGYGNSSGAKTDNSEHKEQARHKGDPLFQV
jgi:hypothetical protein